MRSKLLLATGGMLATLALSVFAADMSQVEKMIELKDGSTLYVFKNGKMGMENKLGRPSRMKPGATMETKDRQKLIMVGDEVMRVESLRSQDSRP